MNNPPDSSDSSDEDGIWEALDPQNLKQLGQKTIGKAKLLYQDFQAFIDQGNVLDLSIGVILGASFSRIVDSLVNDVITPILGLALGSQLENAFLIIRPPDPLKCMETSDTSLNVSLSTNPCRNFKTPNQAQAYGAVTWNYGQFMQAIVNFLITAIFLFLIVRFIQWFLDRRKGLRLDDELSTSTMDTSFVRIEDTEHIMMDEPLLNHNNEASRNPCQILIRRKKRSNQDRNELSPSFMDTLPFTQAQKQAKCPWCLSRVHRKARKCKYCASTLFPSSSVGVQQSTIN